MLQTITVRGISSTPFDRQKWREAIRQFLENVWSGKPRLTPQTSKLIFEFENGDSLTLELLKSSTYIAYGSNHRGELPKLQSGDIVADIRGHESVVNDHLARFLFDRQLVRLTIGLHTGSIVLAKGDFDEELFVVSSQLPPQRPSL